MSRRREFFQRTIDRAKATRGLALMGVCNVTPDSFSDGGLHFAPEAARGRVDELLAQGADIIDVGGESTRPRAEPVPAQVQIARVLDVVRYASSLGACVSIDTTAPEVAAASLDAGACAVNDVSCLLDGALARVVAASGAALVLMHARGMQKDMAGFSHLPGRRLRRRGARRVRRVGERGRAGAVRGRGARRDRHGPRLRLREERAP